VISGLGMLYAPPVQRGGLLLRGVVSAEQPESLVKWIDPTKWVILHCMHDARPPRIDEVTSLYQCDPFFADTLGSLPRVYAIPRDFTDADVYRPLGVEKQYDVVFNACWSEVKRPQLLVQALRYATDAGRPISCLWYGYHFSSAGGTSQDLERTVRAQAAGLPVTFLHTDFDRSENNRRYNSARIAVMTSRSEGGPRVMAEAMLAGLPYLAASDAHGGSAAYLSAANRNGCLFEPTPQGLAECIWGVLDTLSGFGPREWAQTNMCRAVAVARLRHALRELEERSGWHINWREADHDGILIEEWWQLVLAADTAV
jgi:glycosyltransferase involved in cell wall biosynthesis